MFIQLISIFMPINNKKTTKMQMVSMCDNVAYEVSYYDSLREVKKYGLETNI